MDDTIIFIDSGFLSKLSKHFGKGKYLNYKITLLAKNLALKQNLYCNQIFYYTAPPFQSGRPTKEEAERYRKYEKKRNSIFSTSNELIKSVYKYVLLTKEDFNKAEWKSKMKLTIKNTVYLIIIAIIMIIFIIWWLIKFDILNNLKTITEVFKWTSKDVQTIRF